MALKTRKVEAYNKSIVLDDVTVSNCGKLSEDLLQLVRIDRLGQIPHKEFHHFCKITSNLFFFSNKKND